MFDVIKSFEPTTLILNNHILTKLIEKNG